MWTVLTLLCIAAGVAALIALYLYIARRSGRIRAYTTKARKESDGPGGQPDFSGFPCGHDRAGAQRPVTVFGFALHIKHETLCQSCLEKFLAKYSTRCAACEGPILPGDPVGQAWNGAKFPHTHLADGCCEAGTLYCGVWGQGRLVTLHELDPEQFPAGTTTVMSHTYKTGKTTIINIP